MLTTLRKVDRQVAGLSNAKFVLLAAPPIVLSSVLFGPPNIVSFISGSVVIGAAITGRRANRRRSEI